MALKLVSRENAARFVMTLYDSTLWRINCIVFVVAIMTHIGIKNEWLLKIKIREKISELVII